MSDIPNEPAYSKNVIEFITVAHNYCVTLESPGRYDDNDFLEIILKILPLLYLKASLLPALSEPDPAANERFLTLEQYENLFNSLRNILDDKDLTYTLDLNDVDLIPKKFSISESLSDIYQDMKDFVLLYQKHSRTAKQCAVYYARLNYLQHWGIKAINSLKALHNIVYGQYIDSDT
jgi:hypothetical protein